MRAERKIAVVMPARNEKKSINEGRLLERVLEEIPGHYVPKLYVSVSNAEQDFIELVEDIESQDDRIKMLNLGTPDPRGLAYAYLYGLQQAVRDGSEMIIEMDANGAHDPIYIREFLDRLENNKDAAFSSRFGPKGGINKYPLQRQLISRSGTFAANIVLGLNRWVEDMTSGYEAFKKEVLGDVFSTYPIEDWISVTRGPGHFYQTEMRSIVIWRGHDYAMVPIVWGTERMEDPATLPLKTVIKAFQDLFILRSKKNKLTANGGK
jgi:dolichol-phosphate mannosyltransferase